MPAIQQNSSVIRIYVYIHFKIFFSVTVYLRTYSMVPFVYSRSLSPVSPALQVGSLPAWPSGRAPYMRADIC